MKQRRRSPIASMLLFTIVPCLLLSCRSCAVAASTDRQASTSSRGQQDESDPMYDRRTTTMTANNDFDAAESSLLGKDSQNYSEEQFFPYPGSAARRRDVFARRLGNNQKRKRQPNYMLLRVGTGITDTGAESIKSYSSKSPKSSKATVSPAPSVSLAPSVSSAPSSQPSESSAPSSQPSESSAPSPAPSESSQPSLSTAPSESSRPSLSTAPSQLPSTSTAPSLQPSTSIAPSTKSGKSPKSR